MSRPRTLPRGVCRTVFYNPEHRAEKNPRFARPCFYAYSGGKPCFKAKRFMIDRLGSVEALRQAVEWRMEQAAREPQRVTLGPTPKGARR